MKNKIWIISLFSMLCFSSCEKIDRLNNDIDIAIDEMLGITALSEDLNKTSTNYNVISDILINDKLVSSSEIKMTLPTSVPVSYTKKRYTLTGSRWDITTNSYSGTISKSMFNKTSNVVKIVVQNNTSSLYVNNMSVSISGGGIGGTGGTGTTVSSSSKMIGTWLRNDGQASTYLRIEGTTAITCSNGTPTTGSFNPNVPSMTYKINGEVIVFPLAMQGEKLIVKVPSQGTSNHVDTEYIKTTTWPCGGGTTTLNKGSLMVWSNVPEYGFAYNWNVMQVYISGYSNSGTIWGGMYNTAPSCGSSGCYTIELLPGTYLVTGKIYPLKPITGSTPPTYTTTQTVNVVANQCVKILLK